MRKHASSQKTVLHPEVLQKGFTLVELLVVVAILGVLAVGLIGAVNPQAQLIKARNAQRRVALKTIADALDRYRITNGAYPVTNWCGPPGSAWNGSCADPNNWIPGLVASGELKQLPQDPRAGQTFPPCNISSYAYVIYYSDGVDYKLVDHCAPEGTLSQTDPMADPPRWQYSWAIYTPGAVNW